MRRKRGYFMLFADKQHYEFYNETMKKVRNDVYHEALVYTLGISETTRCNFNQIYDIKERTINTEQINKGWQTSSSLRITRLAFNLFTDGEPTAYTYDEKDNETTDIKECGRYSVSDIFCCSYAPFYIQAIKIRYPEYFKNDFYTNEPKGIEF